MVALVTSSEVEAVVRSVLAREGYLTSAERGIGETGTDIVAEKGSEMLHIEAIAFKSSGPARAKDFYEAFFRAVSRIEVGATGCVIALPARFGKGLHQRAKAIGTAWRRIGDAFPNWESGWWTRQTKQLTVPVGTAGAPSAEQEAAG